MAFKFTQHALMLLRTYNLHRNEALDMLTTPPHVVREDVDSLDRPVLVLLCASTTHQVWVFRLSGWENGGYTVIAAYPANEKDTARYMEERFGNE